MATLDFTADKAFINNLQNSTIQNNGSGEVAIGLIFSAKIIGIGHNTGVNSQQTVVVATKGTKDDKILSVVGGDYRVAEAELDEDEEGDTNSLNTVVPVMIRTKSGWEFKSPSRKQSDEKGKVQKIDWL